MDSPKPWYLLFLVSCLVFAIGVYLMTYFSHNASENPDYAFYFMVTILATNPFPLFGMVVLLELCKLFGSRNEEPDEPLNNAVLFWWWLIAYVIWVLLSFTLICGNLFYIGVLAVTADLEPRFFIMLFVVLVEIATFANIPAEKARELYELVSMEEEVTWLGSMDDDDLLQHLV